MSLASLEREIGDANGWRGFACADSRSRLLATCVAVTSIGRLGFHFYDSAACCILYLTTQRNARAVPPRCPPLSSTTDTHNPTLTVFYCPKKSCCTYRPILAPLSIPNLTLLIESKIVIFRFTSPLTSNRLNRAVKSGYH